MQKVENNDHRLMCMKNVLIAFLIICLVASCDKRQTYLHLYQSIPNAGWLSKDSICFQIPAQGNDTSYNVQLEVRHTVKFNYKNLLLLASYVCSNQDEVQTDTINFVLMDEDGRWQGKGIGRLFQVEEQLKTLHIGKSDSCIIKVSYLNPDSLLLGVNDLGLRLY